MEGELDILCKNIVFLHNKGRIAKDVILNAQKHLTTMNQKLNEFYDKIRKDKNMKKIIKKSHLLD